MRENELATEVIGAAIEVHREMGPGLLESIYEECLLHEIRERGIHAEQQVAIPVLYKGKRIKNDLRLDLWIERQVIIEVKALNPVHWAQLMTYLKLTNNRLGLLINFNVKLLKQGVKRIANNL